MTEAILIALGFVGGAVALTFSAYLTMRFLLGRDAHKDKELAASVLTRIAALHALILALVFAQEMVDYQQLRTESAIEANAVSDIYNDANRAAAPNSPEIAGAMIEYLRRVISDEWLSLAKERRLAESAWLEWEKAYEATLTIEPSDDRQAALREHMLSAIHTISEQRVKREMIGQDEISGLFWFAAISGLLFSAAAYYPYDPERRSVLLLSMFGGFTGIVLFLIYALSNPYNSPGALRPGAFERLQEAIAAGR